MPVALAPLGSQGLLAPRVGCGIMSAAFYGSGDGSADESAQLAAIDALVAACAPAPAFIDTAWIYASPAGLHSGPGTPADSIRRVSPTPGSRR